MTEQLKIRTEEILEKKHFCYKNQNITVDKIKDVNGSNIVVFIDNRPRNFFISEYEKFLDELSDPKPPKENYALSPKIEVEKSEMMSFEPTKENSQIKIALLDALKLVKEDPKFIDQANAICNIAGQMINLQKEEIKMLQLIRRK
jgi:hypothetical protein